MDIRAQDWQARKEDANRAIARGEDDIIGLAQRESLASSMDARLCHIEHAIYKILHALEEIQPGIIARIPCLGPKGDW